MGWYHTEKVSKINDKKLGIMIPKVTAELHHTDRPMEVFHVLSGAMSSRSMKCFADSLNAQGKEPPAKKIKIGADGFDFRE